MADHTHKAESATDNPITFDAAAAKFEYSNDEWALANLPKVRIASVMLQRNDVELADTIGQMAKAGIVPDMLDGMIATRDHLKAIVELIDVALARSFVVLDRLGNSPDCPPPDQPMSVQ